ncbi:MAG: hypothetical protein JXX14_01895 [Deltaproteobacteria bacterium]|nr:hypothetical protein [Deltaproteobacteria bacterium]
MKNSLQHCIGFLGRVAPAVRVTVSGVLFLASCLASCNDSGKSSIYGYSGPRNTCVDSSDCVEGACHPTRKVCVVSFQSDDSLWARVIFDSPQLRAQVFKVPKVSTDTLSLDIREPVAIQNLTAPTALSADILFFDLSNTLPGQDPEVFVYKTYLQNDQTADIAPFHLLPGVYDITVYPVGSEKSTLPVTTYKDIQIDAQGVAWQNGVPLQTVLPEAANQLVGKAYYFSSVEGNVAARDLSVQAFDGVSRRALSHPFALSCLSQDDCGRYTIPLPATTQSVEVRFFKPDEPFFPSYIYPIDPLTFTGGIAQTEIVLDPLQKPVLVTGSVNVNPVPDGITPPPACRVLFEMVDDDQRSLQYWVDTNGYGEIERDAGMPGVYLYPGRYKVTVFPVVDSSTLSQTYARTVLLDTLVVSNDVSDPLSEETGITVNRFSLTLDPRLKITGKITYENSLIPSTFITAYNVERVQPYSKVLTTQASESATFDIWLDNNTYYVMASPPAVSMFVAGFGPWNIRKSKNYVFDAEVQVPFVIEGNLNINTDSTWFESTTPRSVIVEWYREYGQTAYRATQTRVQDDYFFSALLPPG